VQKARRAVHRLAAAIPHHAEAAAQIVGVAHEHVRIVEVGGRRGGERAQPLDDERGGDCGDGEA